MEPLALAVASDRPAAQNDEKQHLVPHHGVEGTCRKRQPPESTQRKPADHTIHNVRYANR